MTSQQLLLLNASNMESFPVYPYAFIQVPAVARRAGIDVICHDLLGIPQEEWPPHLLALIEQHRPAMILITLRNTDALDSRHYEPVDSAGEGKPPYFPVEKTKALIAAIRAVSDLKIVVGGFGFSLLSEELMPYLRPDLGVFGGADAFFAHFEDIRRENYAGVANLLYFQDGRQRVNPRMDFPPFDEIEYTAQAIKEMMAFYDSFPEPGFMGAPVEIMRGCCHSCVFCSEPHVAGARVQYRDLSAVMADIEILVDHGITQIYIISSELNPEGNEFLLDLADRIKSFNERQTDDRKITWFGANYLLNVGEEAYERLYRSGFTGGWFDITALDDENARAMRTPYRNKSLLAHLKTYVQVRHRQLGRVPMQGTSQPETSVDENEDAEKGKTIHWTLFLGNPATTMGTIRRTLRVANREGLAQLFDACYLNKNIRVFEYEKPNRPVLDVTYSVTPELTRTEYQQLLPSFAYSPALLKALGSEEAIAEMFAHIGETYLSTRYEETREWSRFVKQHVTAAAVTGWMAELSHIETTPPTTDRALPIGGLFAASLDEIFSEAREDEERNSADRRAKQVVNALLSSSLVAFSETFGSFGLPETSEDLARLTPYQLAVTVFGRWSAEDELLDQMAATTQTMLNESMQACLRFCVLAMLHKFNVQIRPAYKELFTRDNN